ncbi:BolA/IbaG family iron-sulfur metabolism protein [Spongiibacter sp. KMU-158]|uniref:DNA-binding transcriptional regulator BolA n=1 Tax=Spongiibacter pelagi TaxID=2760804 RepID=A0A927C1A3_9GAMM|nr:BolA/IbaG family iron-sulfur metabolism protein [Spongiibacter pelagi]MBD2858187.1 BolA/IbaG family iron-sulfur metabolism protein [Spongiibacter pelagi]
MSEQHDSSSRPVQTAIESKLQTGFQCEYLEVLNESHMHSVPANSETHFKVSLVSADFDGKRKVARHQSVYGLLKDELAGPVHALALHLFTPAEWQERHGEVPASPNCKGGSKNDPFFNKIIDTDGAK